VRGGVVQLQKALMGFGKLEGGARQGKLVVIETPLDITMNLSHY
jgi:hypothetical protein